MQSVTVLDVYQVGFLQTDALSHGLIDLQSPTAASNRPHSTYKLRPHVSAGSKDVYASIAHINPDSIESGQSVARVSRGYVQVRYPLPTQLLYG